MSKVVCVCVCVVETLHLHLTAKSGHVLTRSFKEMY